MGKTVSLSDRTGYKQHDFSFVNYDLKIFLQFTKQKDDLKDHYYMSTRKLMKMFETDIIDSKTYMRYFYFKNSDDNKPKYRKLYTNFTFSQRYRLVKAYRKLLKKSLIRFSGGTTTDVYMSKNKALFRESRLSNLLDG
ncbi:MAG: hypothetical protein SLAVMIC_00704 [uncultured marine phage]|uniref:Uncharacterized protein n=1 Tax=uncultured marine phage TaxID=707152 RepID=A0A8D9FRR9_9VIRU|nr:MAG: hypothetical protein SLAVMIC_00704 [uncultured marine phage]